MKYLFVILALWLTISISAQTNFTNPIIHADYSDPDAVRVGEDYYLTASSFNHIPGLPILHSKDLVHWEIISYALSKQPPFDHYNKVQHGNGVWAPAIRYHDQQFYIYYPDPDFGIYMIKAKDPRGPWTEPVLVQAGKGLIDPCPLWDDDGKLYLVHAFAGSRAGIKSILVIKEMNEAGDKVTSEGVLVYDGHKNDPTVEGPKFYKRNGYYYIFAPAGGVTTGWQIVLRSRNIYGPYERRIVMAQGFSTTNGPHQGAWVNTANGEDWFLHFQDKEAYGRILHLQPMKWLNDWPIIGIEKNGKEWGEPVANFKLPFTKSNAENYLLPATDEFNGSTLGLQWQWQANPGNSWYFTDPSEGKLRLNSQLWTDSNLYNYPALLMQKFPAESFSATMKMDGYFANNGDRAGLMVFGLDYATVYASISDNQLELQFATCTDAEKQRSEKIQERIKIDSVRNLFFRVEVSKNAQCQFGYSLDGKNFTMFKQLFQAKPGKWVGAKLGMYCTRAVKFNDGAYTDIDHFKIYLK